MRFDFYDRILNLRQISHEELGQFNPILRTLLILGIVSIMTIKSEYDYVIIGAGPAGLQLGYFLHKANRRYLIL